MYEAHKGISAYHSSKHHPQSSEEFGCWVARKIARLVILKPILWVKYELSVPLHVLIQKIQLRIFEKKVHLFCND